MSHYKSRIINTPVENIVSNLRGEVGEIVQSWILFKQFTAHASTLQSDDLAADMKNEDLAFINALRDRLKDDVISRLAELGESKIGRLNFYFASEKLGAFSNEVRVYNKYVKLNKFREKRNYSISHKELPEQWEEHRHIIIRYLEITKCVAHAVRLMKKIDLMVHGESSRKQWYKLREKRYKVLYPAKVHYMLLPHLHLD